MIIIIRLVINIVPIILIMQTTVLLSMFILTLLGPRTEAQTQSEPQREPFPLTHTE